MVTAKIGDKDINCFDGRYSKDELKMWAEKNIIKCPVCGKPYEYCHGLINTPYFRHKDKAECEYIYAEAETEEHIKGKVALYNWIKRQKGVTNAVLEAWLPETRQRPDIMFEYERQKYVIEYQCSPISTEYLERHDLYEADGIKDIWICGTEKYMQDGMRIKEIEKYAYGYYSVKTGLFYFQNTHLGYSKSLRHLFYEIDLEDVMGLQEPVDERRNCKDSPYHCCYLDKVNFKNGKVMIKDFDDVDELTESIKIKRNKRREERDRNELRGERKISKLVSFMNTKLSKMAIQDICYLYSEKYDSDRGAWCADFYIKNILTKYGYNTHNSGCKYTVYSDNSTYSSANQIINIARNLTRDINLQEKAIDRGLRYFTQKPNFNIQIVNRYREMGDKKFYCLCKGRSVVTEFEFLTDLIRVMNISQRYSNNIRIKLPQTVELLFGEINSFTRDDIVQAYFNRLGFKNVHFDI